MGAQISLSNTGPRRYEFKPFLIPKYSIPHLNPETCHFLLDILLYAAETSQSTSNITSPQTPQTPSSPSHSAPYPSNLSSQHSKETAQPLFTVEQLTRVKIFLRERPHPYPPRERGPIPGRDQSLFFEIEEKTAQEGTEGGGETVLNASWKTEGTVRFLFGPES